MPYSPHPAADTPQGVAARRGRRFGCGTDVILHKKGLRKVVSLRRHGGSGGRRTEPSASCPERRAGRACAAHKGAGSGGCVGIVRRDGNTPEGFTFRRDRQGVQPRCQTAMPLPETGEPIPRSRLLQRDPSRGQKPLNGVLKGATHTQSNEAASSAPSDAL